MGLLTRIQKPPGGRRLRHLATLAMVLLAGLGSPLAAHADTFTDTYLAPDVQTPNAAAACGGQTNCTIGTETFNELPTGNYSDQTISTNFGTNGAITGTIAGNFEINKADQYGGAGGNGNYIVTFDHNTGYSLDLSTQAGTGVNYFGMDLTALDAGNDLSFYNGNTLVGTYTPQNLITALGACPNGYCGNPNTGQDPNEQFAFVNFYDQSGTFDRIVFTENASFGGGYEADNFTVAYRPDNTVTQGVVVPAPMSGLGATPLGFGVLGIAMFIRRRKAPRGDMAFA